MVKNLLPLIMIAANLFSAQPELPAHPRLLWSDDAVAIATALTEIRRCRPGSP